MRALTWILLSVTAVAQFSWATTCCISDSTKPITVQAQGKADRSPAPQLSANEESLFSLPCHHSDPSHQSSDSEDHRGHRCASPLCSPALHTSGYIVLTTPVTRFTLFSFLSPESPALAGLDRPPAA